MELWIRSQKKGTLIEVKDIRIMQLDKDGFRALIEEDATEGWNIVVNDDPCVGTYATKERALEILEDINKVKWWKYMAELDFGAFVKILNETYNNEEIQEIFKLMNTYEMPEE